MKAENMKFFAARVLGKMKQADEMGTKTTWTTSDHLACLADAVVAQGGERAKVAEVLADCYNVSAFQQTLAKAYASTGHYQRSDKTPKLDNIVAQLEAAARATEVKPSQG